MTTPRKLLTGFLYTLGSGYAARLASVGLTILLKRELEPSIFADAILGVTLFTLLSSLREFGLLHALLHFHREARDFAGTHFLLNCSITLLNALLSSAVAGALAFFFPETFSWKVALIVWIFSLLNLLRNLALTSEALLRADFEFGRLSLFHGLGTLLALGSALVAARAGWEGWSLILGGWSTYSVLSAVYVLFFSAAAWSSRPLSLGSLRFDRAWARRLLQYGAWIWVGWVFQNFVLWYDKLVIWLTVPDREVFSLYEHAWWVVQVPTALITHVVFTYTNALYSRYQQDRQRLSEHFSRMMSLVIWVSSPLALALILNAREVMALTPKWTAAAPLVIWLAGYAFVRPLLDDGFGLLWAVGDTRLSAGIAGIQAAVALVLVPGAAWQWGVKGVALSMGIVAGAGAVGLFIGVRKYVDLRWGRILRAPLLGLPLAAAAGIFYGDHALQAPLSDFCLRSGLMLLIYASMVWLVERREIKENLSQIRRVLRISQE